MKRIVTLLFPLLLAVPSWASQTSYYHIPASACKAAPGTNAQTKGSAGVCLPDTVGIDSKSVWRCTNTSLLDSGIECEFSLPPFALSTDISVRVRYAVASGSTGDEGFYAFFEVTPSGQIWANNTAADCAPSVTNQCTAAYTGTDHDCVVPVSTCNQATAAYCASVSACTGTVGLHGILQVYRDNTTFSPNLNGALNIEEVIIGVTTP